MKQIKTVVFIKTNDGKLTKFNSAIEKKQYIADHVDAVISTNCGIEPLYMLVDTEGTGWCLNPKRAVTYNEALELLRMYF